MKLRDIAIALFFLTAPSVRSEQLPVFVPLGQTDLDDPQVGYMHMSIGMEGGKFFFAKEGDPIEQIKTVSLDKFYFDEDSKEEVINGFIPKYGACFFNQKWKCFIASSRDGITKNFNQAYSKELSKTHLTDLMFCEDCKPIPQPMMTRICPGFYSQHITGNEFKDKTIPTYPEFFNKDGNCIYEKPWTVSSSNQKSDTFKPSMEQMVIVQSSAMRCMIEEKILTKDQAITMMKNGAKVTPQLFNPAIKILENGATDSQKKEQDFAIQKLGGCKNYIRFYIEKTMPPEDAKKMLDNLDKTGFNDDLLGRPKSYFNQKLKMVFCKEPIQEFTLNYGSNPTDKQVESLCSCLWNKFPEGRWEREELKRLFNGGEPNWKTRGMMGRFGKAMNVCGGYEL